MPSNKGHLKSERSGTSRMQAPRDEESSGSETDQFVGGYDTEGRFTAKFDEIKGKCWTMAYFILHDLFWHAWLVALLILAIWGQTNTDPSNTAFALSTYTWYVTGTLGAQVIWFLITSFCAIRNQRAAKRGETEKPCMSLRYGVMMSFIWCGMWGTILAFVGRLYANRDPNNNYAQGMAFAVNMEIIIVGCALSLYDPLRDIFGSWKDKMTISSGSHCFDC